VSAVVLGTESHGTRDHIWLTALGAFRYPNWLSIIARLLSGWFFYYWRNVFVPPKAMTTWRTPTVIEIDYPQYSRVKMVAACSRRTKLYRSICVWIINCIFDISAFNFSFFFFLQSVSNYIYCSAPGSLFVLTWCKSAPTLRYSPHRMTQDCNVFCFYLSSIYELVIVNFCFSFCVSFYAFFVRGI
jgi:hypothetical protein